MFMKRNGITCASVQKCNKTVIELLLVHLHFLRLCADIRRGVFCSQHTDCRFVL